MKKKKIAYLFISLHKGGMQNAVSRITRALDGEFQQFVVYFVDENPGFHFNANVFNLNIDSLSNSPLHRIFIFLKRILVLRKFLKKNKIDTIISFGEGANIVNLLLPLKITKIISIRVSIIESIKEFRFKSIYEFLIKKLYPRAGKIVVVSEELQNELNKIINCEGVKAKTHLIPNLYFFDELKSLAKFPLPKEFQFLLKEKYILNVGSYSFQKGQDILIKEFFKSGLFNNYYLVLVGRGPEHINLIELSNSLGIEDRVIFTGFQKNPYSFIYNSEMFVLSSRYEGFPNVLIESLILGKACISFDCPTGPKEIIKDGYNGVLLSGFSMFKKLSDAMVFILNNPYFKRNIETNAFNSIKHLESQKISKLWLDLIVKE